MHPHAAHAVSASFQTIAQPAITKFYALVFAFMAAAPLAMGALSQIA
ncbi:MAG: hypothetical protein J0L81_09515 [Caulobacterales bacterium]|jgi:hypothetical protein|nr:hypothetical protein [Caulobacterales bacterium]